MLLRRPEVGNKKDMAPSTAAKSKVEYAGESEEEEVFEDPVGQEEAVMVSPLNCSIERLNAMCALLFRQRNRRHRRFVRQWLR